jgi:DNA-binding transcriptional regulator YdaS (Cro superfamily)
MKTALDIAVARLGGQGAMGRALGISRQAVGQWIEKGACPVERAVEIEELTEGVVTREMLRPDIFVRTTS